MPAEVSTLFDIVVGLDELDEEATIYAAMPWTDQSRAIIAYEPDDGSLPPEAKGLGIHYFIGVYTAKEFLEGFSKVFPEWQPYGWLKCARLVVYAIYDA